MKKRPFDNRIIVIGADHHNTLAAIRAFGRENCEIAVVIHGHQLTRKKIQVFSSRYVDPKQTYIIENDPAALLEVLSRYGDTDRKDILFPASDFAEYVIDSNSESLSECFVVPGFVGAPGKVCKMMDKWNQYLFAQEYGIPMAPTFLIDTRKPQIPDAVGYPCIVKPRLSAMGSKTDIVVCENQGALSKTFDDYREKGYTDCIAQVFLNKDYEANSLGFILTTKQKRASVCAVAVKLREQMESATSYAVMVGDLRIPDGNEDHNKQLLKTNQRIVRALQDDGYSGHFDIDYLVCNGTVCLNEINFRHSGNGYALVNDTINAPFLWASGMLDNAVTRIPEQYVKAGSHFMAEIYDSIYIKRREMTIFQWIRDVRRASSFAVYDPHDMRATRRYYRDRIRGVLWKATKHALRLR